MEQQQQPRRADEPEAAYLRRTRQLWPEHLTETELREAWRSVRADTHPISAQMLDAEMRARGLR